MRTRIQQSDVRGQKPTVASRVRRRIASLTSDLCPLTSCPGFNLVEVMFSILILGVGLIAVASLFPVAGTIQQRSMADVDLVHQKANAIAILQNDEIELDIRAALDAHPAVTAYKQTGMPFQLDNFALIVPIQDRLSPSVNPTSYWSPVFRWDNVQDDWEVFICILRVVEGVPNIDQNVTRDGQPAYGDTAVDARPDSVDAGKGQQYRLYTYSDEATVDAAQDAPAPGSSYHARTHGKRSTALGWTYLGANQW